MKNQMNIWKSTMEQPRWDEALRWFNVHYKNHVNIIEGTDERTREPLKDSQDK